MSLSIECAAALLFFRYPGRVTNRCAAIPKMTPPFSVLGFISDSTILGGNAFYQSRLYQFLTPAVGLTPQWVLCYRASTQGWDTSNFHSRCDGKRDTVTIIKTGQFVFGGYTDIPWGITHLLFKVIQYLIFTV